MSLSKQWSLNQTQWLMQQKSSRWPDEMFKKKEKRRRRDQWEDVPIMALCLLQRYMSEKLSQEHQKTLDTLASSMYFCTAMDMKRRSAWCETTSPDSSCNTDTPCIHALKTSCLQKYLYNTLTRTSLNTHTAHTRQTTYDKSILPSPQKKQQQRQQLQSLLKSALQILSN